MINFCSYVDEIENAHGGITEEKAWADLLKKDMSRLFENCRFSVCTKTLSGIGDRNNQAEDKNNNEDNF